MSNGEAQESHRGLGARIGGRPASESSRPSALRQRRSRRSDVGGSTSTRAMQRNERKVSRGGRGGAARRLSRALRGDSSGSFSTRGRKDLQSG